MIIVTHTLLSFYSYSWCYAPPSLAPLGPKVGGFILGWWGCHREYSASGVLQWEECEVDGDDFFLTLEFSGVSFMIVSMLLHLVFSSLD